MIERIILARSHDIGGLIVGRVLPTPHRRSVGPFVFLDHMGPAKFEPGVGFDVRPHPHIGLATLTYLFEGEQVHRDSLGTVQTIRPRDVNLMIAGRGVAHSERATDALRKQGGELHGLQFWLALPEAEEDCEPSFHHADAVDLPLLEDDSSRGRVALGRFAGETSPIVFPAPATLLDLSIDEGEDVVLPLEPYEYAVYVISGSVLIDDTLLPARTLAVLELAGELKLRAREDVRVVLFGGVPLERPRRMYWNFVATNDERIERAKEDWRERRFPPIPGDDAEFIPLPET